MCIFTSPVGAVSDTRIFVRMASAGRQYLAYEMSFAAMGDTAMVLPLPVASRDEATAVRFIDLSGTPDFFDRIGRFVWMFEERYRDYGFAVFQLRATGTQARHAHPMALEFSTRLADKLFAPTVHVHDGVVHMHAFFDHVIYAQVESWATHRPAYFDSGLRQEGDAERVAREQWEKLRARGDWRLPQHEGNRHRVGLVLPAQSRHPPTIRVRFVPEWRALKPSSRKSIVRMCAHTLTLEEQCKGFARAIWKRSGATPAERAAFPRIERLMDILCAVQIEAETVRRWWALGSADQELALRNRAVQGSDAAGAWMALPEDQRERFSRIQRWDELPPLLAAEISTVLQWMDRNSGPRRDAARKVLAKEYFPLFTEAPDSLLRAADADDAERLEAIRQAVLKLEPGIDEEAARLWGRIHHWDWSCLKEFAEVDELWPLFDATREIHAVGLSGTLPNRDTLISVSGGYEHAPPNNGSQDDALHAARA